MTYESEPTSWNGSNNEWDYDEEFDWQVEEDFEYIQPWNSRESKFDNNETVGWQHVYRQDEPQRWFW